MCSHIIFTLVHILQHHMLHIHITSKTIITYFLFIIINIIHSIVFDYLHKCDCFNPIVGMIHTIGVVFPGHTYS